MAKGPRVIYWFRTDLRLHDSPALQAALDLKPEAFWPVWTWDPHYVYRARVGINRWQFLIDCQNDVSKAITKVNSKSKLFIVREAPQTVLPKLFKTWGVTHLVFEKDTDSYARDRDEVVMKAAKDAGVEVIVKYGHTLWDSDEIVAKNGGKPTMSITQLGSAGDKIGKIPAVIDAPRSLPDPGDLKVDELEKLRERPAQQPDYNAEWRTAEEKGYTQIAGPNKDFAAVTLEEMGFPAATTHVRGGESEALKRLDKVFSTLEYPATFRKPQTSPAAFDPQATTLLSPFLHFGALSCRLFYHKSQDAVDRLNKKHKGAASTPPESLTGQLLFRDMYFAAQAALGHAMDQTIHNPTVRFVPWHLPSKYSSPETHPSAAKTHAVPAKIPLAIPGQFEVDNPQAEEWFHRWRHGLTGFPWIDALMRQLKQEGWIHHLGRHSVACFLTRGGCYIHWERGAEVFAEWLIDHEPACNAGNWQWLSCTAFYSQYYRCYSPVAFGQKWDKEGKFVKRYCPELKELSAKYIYEPWKAPIADQKSAGVRVVAYPGKGEEMEKRTYPKPMFDFGERRKICIASLKQAYEVGLHGNDEKVIDGTWRELFEARESGDTEMQDEIGEHEEDHDDIVEDNTGDADKHEAEKGKKRTASSKGKESGQSTMDRHLKKQRSK